MRNRGRAFWALVAAAATLVGCGSGSKFDGTGITVVINPQDYPVTTNYFWILMLAEKGGCPLSANATLKINGTTQPFGSCSGQSDQFQGNPSFAVQVADGDDQAEMDVAGLVPGLDATIVSPRSGQVASGGTVTLSAPPALQGQMAQLAVFNNTSNVDPYAGAFVYPMSLTGDGQTVAIPAPAHAATYQLVVDMAPATTTDSTALPSASVLSCKGFATCYAQAIDRLGPVQVTVTP